MNAGLFIPYGTRDLVTYEVCRECYRESGHTLFARATTENADGPSCEEHNRCSTCGQQFRLVAPDFFGCGCKKVTPEPLT